MGRSAGLSTIFPRVRRAVCSHVGDLSFSAQSPLPPVDNPVARVFASGIEGRAHGGAAALNAWESEFGGEEIPLPAAPTPLSSSSDHELQVPQDGGSASTVGLFLLSYITSALNLVNDRPISRAWLQSIFRCTDRWYQLVAKQTSGTVRLGSNGAEDRLSADDAHWMQSRVSVALCALAFWAFPALHGHNSGRTTPATWSPDELQLLFEFLKRTLRNPDDSAGSRGCQLILSRCAPPTTDAERMKEFVNTWMAARSAESSSARDADFWFVTLTALATSVSPTTKSVPAHVPSEWLDAGLRSVLLHDTQVKGFYSGIDVEVPHPFRNGMFFPQGAKGCFVCDEGPLEQVWRMVASHQVTTDAVAQRRAFLAAVVKIRLSHAASSTNPMGMPPLFTTVHEELQWIHKTVRGVCSVEYAGTGSSTTPSPQLAPIFDVGQWILPQYTDTPSGALGQQQHNDWMRVYLNGTVLLHVGHRVDNARDWSLSLHNKVTVIVQDTIELLTSTLTNIAASADVPDWHATIRTRAHEGLRLAIKSYLKARSFAEATAVYERYPAMGASWELAKCYAELNQPNDAVRLGSLFLVSSYHLLTGPKKDQRSGGGGKSRALPPWITKTLLSCVEACGKHSGMLCIQQSGGAHTNTLRDAIVGSTTQSVHISSSQVDASPSLPPPVSLRECFLNLMETFPLPGVPHVQSWERFLRGCIHELVAVDASPPHARVKDGWLIPVLAAVRHGEAISMNRKKGHHGIDAYDPQFCGLSTDALACVCFALSHHIIAASEGEDALEREASFHCAFVSLRALDAALPRIGVWGLSVTWFLLRSGQPHVAVELLTQLLSSSYQRQDEMRSVVLSVLDSMSKSVVQSLHETLSAMMREEDGTAGKVVKRGREILGVIEGLITSSLDQKVSFALPQQTAELDAQTSSRWICVYCHHDCSASQRACPVCSTLRLHLWRCRRCHGFSPSTHPHDCLVCGAARDHTQSGGRTARHEAPEETVRSRGESVVDTTDMIPLRSWTCKFCRKKNEPTHPFFCGSCKEPSKLAFQLPRSIAPFDCNECGAKQHMGMLRPWCDECGALHPIVSTGGGYGGAEDDPSPHTTGSGAMLWSCSVCAQWNPWVLFHCVDCDASRPHAAAHRLDISWQRWTCDGCDGRNVMWKPICTHCRQPRPRNCGALHVDDDEGCEAHVAADLSTISDQDVEASSPVMVCAADRRRDLNRCENCGLVGLASIQGHCECCGFSRLDSAHPIMWVCLRSGCLHLNCSASSCTKSDDQPARCEKCNVAKGLTTTLAAHTNIFRFNKDGQREASKATVEPSTVALQQPEGEGDSSNEANSIMRFHQPATPAALDVWSPAPGSAASQCCLKCREPLSAWNLLRLCPVCLHGCWAPSPAEATNELVLWLFLSSSEELLRVPEEKHNSRALVLLEVCVRALQNALDSQLPWRGRDVQNMLCAESTTNPVHEPEGRPHSGLSRVARILTSAMQFASIAPSGNQKRKWLGLAVSLVELVNNTTDMDELTFDVVSNLALQIRDLGEDDPWQNVSQGGGNVRGGELPPPEANQAFTDKLRLEYLLSMKLPIECMVGEDRCRTCLFRRCRCGQQSDTLLPSTALPRPPSARSYSGGSEAVAQRIAHQGFTAATNVQSKSFPVHGRSVRGPHRKIEDAEVHR